MFGRRKKEPSKPFDHQADCKILAADPGAQIPWSEVRAGYWEARCVCGTEVGTRPTLTVFGSTRSMRGPAAIWGSASSPPRPMRPCFGSY